MDGVWKHSLTIFCSCLTDYWDRSRTNFHQVNTVLSSSAHAEEKLEVWVAFNFLLVSIMCVITSEAHRRSGACTHSLTCFYKDLLSVCPAIVNLNPLTSSVVT